MRFSHLREARYNPGLNSAAADADLLRRYRYLFDLGGNRTQEIATVVATTTTTDYEYNAANQTTRRVNAGAWVNYAYDPNGNLTSDGTNSYTWDRANRLLSRGTTSYAYDGFGNRIRQTVSATVTNYLLDLQPGLAVVLAETTGANTTRYVHAPRGIHAHKDAANNWEWPLQDGLGSLRGVASNAALVLESRNYAPYGDPFGATGTSQTPYGFTGEPTDGNGLVYLRARYYSPALGVFASRDPFEGMAERAMSLNGYSWVEGNVPNATDPSGMQCYFGHPADNVISNCGLGCETFWAGVNSASLQDFIARNPVLTGEASAASVLLVSLHDCGCEEFRMRDIRSKSHPMFTAVHTNLLNRKDRLRNLLSTSQCGDGLWGSLYTEMIDYIEPGSCFNQSVQNSNNSITLADAFRICTFATMRPGYGDVSLPIGTGATLCAYELAGIDPTCFTNTILDFHTVVADILSLLPATAPIGVVASIIINVFKAVRDPSMANNNAVVISLTSAELTLVEAEARSLSKELIAKVYSRLNFALSAGVTIMDVGTALQTVINCLE